MTIVCAMVDAGGNRSVVLQVERQVADPGRTAAAGTREAVLIGNDLEVRHVQFDETGDSVLVAKDQLFAPSVGDESGGSSGWMMLVEGFIG